MRLTLLALGSLAFANAAAAITTAYEDSRTPWNEGDISWEFVTKDGESVFVNGTAQEVVAKLAKSHPHLKTVMDDDEFEASKAAKGLGKRGMTSATVVLDSSDSPSGGHLIKLQDPMWDSLTCSDIQYGRAEPYAIEGGIKYLHKVNGKPTNGAGPSNCGRVSCSDNSAIWWCNENPESKTLDDFDEIADGANLLEKHCATSNDIEGIAKAKDNWSVRVSGADC